MIRTHNLTKQFGSLIALDRVNLEVNKGEIYGVIGPNGAGKSTMFRLLLGILKATSGEASIFGLDVWKRAVDIHKRLAYVPGNVNLWPHLTGGEVIDLFISLRGLNDKKRRNELIEMFDLDPSKKCRTYSKENQQKVALISALSADAELYILDEPTAGLDPFMARVFQRCIHEVKELGKSVLLSGYILSEVERLCDKISLIWEGKIIDSGTLLELRHLTRTMLTVETKQPMPYLAELKGVHDLQESEYALTFLVDSEYLNDVITYVSHFGIVRLESAPPSLEDVFMRHYTDERGGRMVH